MPDTTPNLGLVLSRYEDQEHLELPQEGFSWPR
jgi:hypothetical protein